MKKVSKKKSVENKPSSKTKNKEQNFLVVNENPVHFKLGYHEALESKRDLLSSEISFLNLMKIIKRYTALRLEELRIKSEIYTAIRELDSSIKKTKSVFPFLKIPERVRRKEIVKREIVEKIKPIREVVVDEDLESQLKNIQDKLKSIGR